MAIPFEPIVEQDLSLGYGTTDVSMPAGGTANGTKIGLHSFGGRFWYSALDFSGVLADGANDDTAGLRTAYAQAKADKVGLWLPPNPNYARSQYRITSTLTWDGPVSVRGAGCSSGGLSIASWGGTRILKAGNFIGIKVLSGGENVQYSDFLLDSAGGDSTTGLYLDLGEGGAGTHFQNLGVLRMGSHGIEFVNGAKNVFTNVFAVSCGGDGLKLIATGSSYVTANTFVGLDLRGCTGYGLNIAGGGQGTYGNSFLGLVAEDNDSYQVRSNSGLPNFIECYTEDSAGTATGDVLLDTNSVRHIVIVKNSSINNPAVVDNGTNNMVFDLSTGRWWMPSLTIAIPGTNIAGRDLSVFGGRAGAGGTGRAGGRLALGGGDAFGTAGAANGGGVDIDAGSQVNGGSNGVIQLAGNVAGGIRVGGTAAVGASVAMDFQSVTRVPLLPRLTTAERDALTPVNGMIIYHSTGAKVQVYEGGAWANVV